MYEDSEIIEPVSSSKRAQGLLFGKIYLYMFLELLITGFVSLLAGYGFTRWIAADPDTATKVLILTLVVSLIGMIIVSFVTSYTYARGTHSVIVPMVIYAILMGLVFSFFVMFVDSSVMVNAVAVTSLAFLLMSLIGYFSKGKLSPLALCGIGLLGGAVLLSLSALLLFWLIPDFEAIYLLIDFIILAAFMCFTIFDIRHVREVASSGYVSGNTAFYCAFILYTDFMNILIRILSILARSRR